MGFIQGGKPPLSELVEGLRGKRVPRKWWRGFSLADLLAVPGVVVLTEAADWRRVLRPAEGEAVRSSSSREAWSRRREVGVLLSVVVR